jgi:hypothetical protein
VTFNVYASVEDSIACHIGPSFAASGCWDPVQLQLDATHAFNCSPSASIGRLEDNSIRLLRQFFSDVALTRLLLLQLHNCTITQVDYEQSLAPLQLYNSTYYSIDEHLIHYESWIDTLTTRSK